MMNSTRRTIWVGVLGVLVLLAASDVRAVTLTHQYRLDGSYADDLGGPSLVPNGGTLGATRYTFGADQGLSLSNALTNNADYSIELVFQFQDLSSYRRILD